MFWKDKFPKSNRYYEEATGILYNANSLDILKEIPDNSIDTVITDPPYGLSNHSEKLIRETLNKWLSGEEDYIPKVRGFMNATWDAFVPPPALWKEVYRVMKPGATALVFAGTRTQDLMTISLRLAGFEVKDTLLWIFSQGFPKGIDISKQIDKKPKADLVTDFKKWLKSIIEKSNLSKKEINKRCGFTATSYANYDSNDYWASNLPSKEKWKIIKKVLNIKTNEWDFIIKNNIEERGFIEPTGNLHKGSGNNIRYSGKQMSNNPVSPEAKLWNGYKSALKPAYEPIILAIKPIEGSYAQNALKWGVAGLNIKNARIGTDTYIIKGGGGGKGTGWGKKNEINEERTGRFPANILFECTCEHIEIEPTEVKPPEEVKGGIWKKSEGKPCGNTYKGGAVKHTDPNCPCYMLDKQSGLLKSGYMSPEKHKRNKTKGIYQSPHGIYGKFNNYELLETYGDKGGASRFFYCAKASKKECGEGTQHPTIKPLKLLEYLVKLTSMPGKDQIYLDPFVGSGSLAMVCKKLNKNWIAIEISKEYSEIAKHRIKAIETQLNLWR